MTRNRKWGAEGRLWKITEETNGVLPYHLRSYLLQPSPQALHTPPPSLIHHSGVPCASIPPKNQPYHQNQTFTAPPRNRATRMHNTPIAVLTYYLNLSQTPQTTNSRLPIPIPIHLLTLTIPTEVYIIIKWDTTKAIFETKKQDLPAKAKYVNPPAD